MDAKFKSNTHRDELVEARNRLAEMFASREHLDIEIARQQRRVAALTALVNESEEVDELLDLNLGGMTDAVRTVFMAAGGYGLTPVEVRDRLARLYFPVNEYKNFMASLHSVLNRLEKNGEIKPVIVDRHDGRDASVYQWIPKYSKRLRGRFSESRFKSRFNRMKDM
jgi:hypothetical protein